MGIIPPKWFLNMEKIHLIGSSTLTGESFLHLFSNKFKIISYSRKNKNSVFLDINSLKTYSNIDYEQLNDSFIVSFAPIWVTAKFLSYLSKIRKYKSKHIKAVICFSTTSVLTKRFATNRKDKELVDTLLSSEKNIYKICKNLEISCLVIRPTLIYGRCGSKTDNNLFKLAKIIKFLPFVILPKNIGLRQPIHAFQLAKITFFYLKKFSKLKDRNFTFEGVNIGGDEVLSYRDMISRILNERNKTIFSNKKIFTVPNFLFYIIISPFLFISPKIFETIFRISSNFSGFTKCSDLIGESSKKFPYINY